MSLGENIKKIRKQRGLTQKQLAELAGITRSQISNIEKGVRSTTATREKQIADALGVSVGDFYDNVNKVNLDDGYVILTEELKEEGIDPETARKWIKFAKQFINENKG